MTISWNIPVMPHSERDRRFAAVRRVMDEAGLAALVVAGHQGNYGDRNGNLRWFANYEPWFDDEYVVFPGAGEPVLMAWSEPHAEWARKVSWIDEVVPAAQMSRGVGGKLNYPVAIAEVLRGWGAVGRVGVCDLATMPASVYIGLRTALPGAELVDAGPMVARLRMLKSEPELDFVRKACACGDIGLQAMVAAARPGVTETELFVACESAMTLAGAASPSFTMLASSPTLAAKGLGMPYGGSGRMLAAGDIIVNELTPSYGGYWAQLDSPIVLGPVPADLRAMLDVHRRMYDAALASMRPGVTIAAVNAQGRVIAEEGGCDPTPAWSIAHIGLNIRDDLPPDTELQPGMTFALQPFTQHDRGAYGGHTVGATVLVTEDGCEVLNADPQVFLVGDGA